MHTTDSMIREAKTFATVTRGDSGVYGVPGTKENLGLIDYFSNDPDEMASWEAEKAMKAQKVAKEIE